MAVDPARRDDGTVRPLGGDVPLAGTCMTVDLGGLPTGDGRTTVPGAVVRSDSLQRLTDAGWRTLAGRGLTTVVDLRSAFELDRHGYRCPLPDVRVVRAPWEDGLLDDPEFRDWAESGVLSSALYYERFLERWPERTATVVRTLAGAAPGLLLFHCQRGRERTGLVALLLLRLAGVPTDVVVAEHLRLDHRLSAHGPTLGHPGLDGEAALYAAHGTTAEATLPKVPAARMRAVRLMVLLAPLASSSIVHGSVVQAPLTPTISRLVGVSVTWMPVAADGPALLTTMLYSTSWPTRNGRAVTSVFSTETSAEASSLVIVPVALAAPPIS